MKKKATYADLYETFSQTVWKTGLELLREIEEQDKKVGHLKGVMYVQFNRWEDEGYIRSRKRELTSEMIERGLTLHQREYLRISSGIPEELEGNSGLEACLVPT